MMDKERTYRIAQAHRCYDRNGNFKYYEALTYPRTIVTSEQIDEAKVILEENHRRELESIRPGDFVMVQMGAEHECEVGTYRARCYFKNIAGKRYFMEITLGMNKDSYTVNFSIDVTLDEEYEKKCWEVHEWNRSHRPSEYMKWPDQNQYNACGAKNATINGTTWKAVIDFVNRTYGCNYTAGRLTRWCDIDERDYYNTCKS